MNIYQKRSLGVVIVAAVVALSCFVGYYRTCIKSFFLNNTAKNHYMIKEYKHEEHIQDVYKMVLDDWYWMMEGITPEEYNFEKRMQEAKVIEDNKEKDLCAYVMTDNKKVIAFCSFYIYSEEESEKIGRILLLIVDKEYRRKNLAATLLHTVLDDLFRKQSCDKVFLITRTTNTRSQNLYKKHGFSLVDDTDGTVTFLITRDEFDTKNKQ